jgi:predicted RND superfamily exporter protein
MFGTVAFFNIKLNFFNFIAIPLTFGICVDYGANLYLRYKQDGNIRDSLDNIGQAIFLCSLTTIVSYLTLMTAKNQALVSFGKIALIGEIASILATFFVLPAVIITMDKLKQQKDTTYIIDDEDATNKKVKAASEKDSFCDYQ